MAKAKKDEETTSITFSKGELKKKDYLETASKIFVSPVEDLPIEAILHAPYNPRDLSDKEYKKLKNSIVNNGYVSFITVNKRSMHIVGGNQRLDVLAELGFKIVRCNIVDLDLNGEMALNLALNKTGGVFNNEKLAEVFAILAEDESADYLNSLTGFDPEEIQDIMSIAPNAEEFDFEGDNSEDSDNNGEGGEDVVDGKDKTTNSVADLYLIINFDNIKDFNEIKQQYGLRDIERVLQWSSVKNTIGVRE
jgi:hypothetical protein